MVMSSISEIELDYGGTFLSHIHISRRIRNIGYAEYGREQVFFWLKHQAFSLIVEEVNGSPQKMEALKRRDYAGFISPALANLTAYLKQGGKSLESLSDDLFKRILLDAFNYLKGEGDILEGKVELSDEQLVELIQEFRNSLINGTIKKYESIRKELYSENAGDTREMFFRMNQGLFAFFDDKRYWKELGVDLDSADIEEISEKILELLIPGQDEIWASTENSELLDQIFQSGEPLEWKSGAEHPAGCYIIGNLLRKMKSENEKFLNMLWTEYNIDVTGTPAEIVALINKAVAEGKISRAEADETIKELETRFGVLREWDTKLSESLSMDVTQELQQIARQYAYRLGIKRESDVVEFIDSFLDPANPNGVLASAQRLARWALYFTLPDGRILRDTVGNLLDMAIPRKAARLALKGTEVKINKTIGGKKIGTISIPDELVDNPLGYLNRFTNIKSYEVLNRVVKELFYLLDVNKKKKVGEKEVDEYPLGYEFSYEDIKKMLILVIAANIIDSRSPDMDALQRSAMEVEGFIEKHVMEAIGTPTVPGRDVSPAFGGDFFIKGFYNTIIEKEEQKAVTLGYIPDNNGQAVFGLYLIQAMLKANPNLKVIYFPKKGTAEGNYAANDVTYQDVLDILTYDVRYYYLKKKGFEKDVIEDVLELPEEELSERLKQIGLKDAEIEEFLNLQYDSEGPGLYEFLRKELGDGRFKINQNGPQIQGVDPQRMSLDMAEELAEVDYIMTEGQGNAEFKWRKPGWMGWETKGRMAETSHGVDKDLKLLAFVPILPDRPHFYGIEASLSRVVQDPITGNDIKVAEFTTVEYVRKILSEWLDDYYSTYPEAQ